MARKDSHIAATLKAIAAPAGDSKPASPSAADQLILQLRDIVADPNIVGFAVGRKITGGHDTGDSAATFYVRRKQPLAMLRAARAIPPVIVDRRGRAILTDIIETGRLVLHLQVGRNPVRGGYSIAHKSGSAGTLGAIVAKEGRPCGLGAQHVLANRDRGQAGDAILFPATADGGTATDRIGMLLPYRPLSTAAGYPNAVDAALCLLDPDVLARLDPALPGARRPLAMTDPVAGMRVRISGRTSGEAHSTIGAIGAYADFYHRGLGTVGFHGLAACGGYATGGDSGALVIDEASGSAVGLHIGGSDTTSYFMPIRTAARALDFEFA